jgi:hypothetical protein
LTMDPLRVSLPRKHGSVRRARWYARAALSDWGCRPDHVDAVEYVVGELTTESLEHGVGPILLTVEMRAHVTRVEVGDGMTLAGETRLARKRTLDEIARASGVADTSGGRVLWAEVE